MYYKFTNPTKKHTLIIEAKSKLQAMAKAESHGEVFESTSEVCDYDCSSTDTIGFEYVDGFIEEVHSNKPKLRDFIIKGYCETVSLIPLNGTRIYTEKL